MYHTDCKLQCMLVGLLVTEQAALHIIIVMHVVQTARLVLFQSHTREFIIAEDN